MLQLKALQAIVAELGRAEAKFPTFPTDPIHAAAIVQEEAGELVRAALQFTYEGGDLGAIEREAVQTGAMALRLLSMLPQLERRPSPQVKRTS